jgi:hypothetical protein
MLDASRMDAGRGGLRHFEQRGVCLPGSAVAARVLLLKLTA